MSSANETSLSINSTHGHEAGACPTSASDVPSGGVATAGVTPDLTLPLPSGVAIPSTGAGHGPPQRSSAETDRINAVQQAMKRGPRGSFGPPLAASSSKHSQAASASSKTSPSAAAAALASSTALASSLPARQTRRIARKLLSLVACPACEKPCDHPVTLPCGHSTCMACIKSTIRKAMANNVAGPSRASHVPPRLPLCSITVPCSVNGCPRSAIGQGLGMWAGYSAAFGPPEGDGWVDLDENSNTVPGTPAIEDPGMPPVDGFVVGAQNESLRLGVIPAQPRAKANSFALSPFPPDEAGGNVELTLRPDVTLAKTIAVLQRYAKEPASASRQTLPPQRARRAYHGFASARRMNSHQHHPYASSPPSSQRPSASSVNRRGSAYFDSEGQHASSSSRPGATPIDPRLRAILGGSEADRESGSIAGVRATDTDDEDASPPPHASFRTARMFRHLSDSSHDDSEQDEVRIQDDDMDEDFEDYNDDDDDDDFGGAFARPRMPMGYGEEAERQRLQRYLTMSQASRASNNKLAPADYVPEHDDMDTSEDSAMSAHVSGKDKEITERSPSSGEESVKLITPEHLQSDLIDTLECQLCYMLLYQPLTIPCGHTFCRSCFARSLDHSSSCPLCRASMPSFSFFQDHPLNQGLIALLNSHFRAPGSSDLDDGGHKVGEKPADVTAEAGTFPEEDLLSMSRLGVFADSKPMSSEPDYFKQWQGAADEEQISFGLRQLYRERAESAEREEAELSSWVPIFVCTLTFPGMPTNLHIFEPRYRLMIRRCLQSAGPSRFGMVLPSRQVNPRTGGLSEYGTMLEIKSCQMLLDGRSMLETVGWKRFRLLEAGSLDGYTTGRIEYIEDDSPQAQAAEEAAVLQSNAEITRRNRQQERRRQEAERYGRSPSDDAEREEMMNDLQSSTDPYVAMAATRDPQARVQRSATSREGSPPSVVLPPLSEQGASGAVAAAAPDQREPYHSLHNDFAPQALKPTLSDLINVCVGFLETLRTQTAPGLFDQIVATYGPVPHPLETDKLGWWLGMVLPIDEIAKSMLLPIRSPRQRLEMIVGWIERIQQQWRPYA